MRTTPERGGAIVLNPGMNLATSSERAPCRVKMRCVRLTHESGSSETRHKRPRTRAPRRRPIAYHPGAAASEAAPARARGERRAQMIGPDERARREQNGDRRYGQTDLFGEYCAEDDPVAVPSEHGDDGVHISRGLRSPCHARSNRTKCDGASASRRSCPSSLTAAPSPDVKLRPLSFRAPSMTWIHACRPGPSLCARLAPAVIRLAKTLASWWNVIASSPPSFAATSLSVSCSSAGAMVRCS